MTDKQQQLTCEAAGRVGGEKRSAALGREGYRALGLKGGAATKARYGTEHYQRIGRLGGLKGKGGRPRQAEITLVANDATAGTSDGAE